MFGLAFFFFFYRVVLQRLVQIEWGQLEVCLVPFLIWKDCLKALVFAAQLFSLTILLQPYYTIAVLTIQEKEPVKILGLSLKVHRISSRKDKSTLSNALLAFWEG